MKNLLFDLDAEMFMARANIEKAESALVEICEEYFSDTETHTPATPTGRSKIVSGFKQNRVFAEIARDYVVQVRQALTGAAALITGAAKQAVSAETLKGSVAIQGDAGSLIIFCPNGSVSVF